MSVAKTWLTVFDLAPPKVEVEGVQEARRAKIPFVFNDRR